MNKEQYRQAAAELYSSDGIEIEIDGLVSEGDEGAFVQAWVWVPCDKTECDACQGSGECQDCMHDEQSMQDCPSCEGLESCNECGGEGLL